MPAAATVQLHLLRHAHAGDPAKWQGPDDLRPLSAKGRHQAEALGRHLDGVGLSFDLLVSSPLVRARQTAELVAERLALPVVVDGRLAAGRAWPRSRPSWPTTAILVGRSWRP